MNYLSICSGIEAASVAWHPLGWKPVGFSEIEKFPCAVLAARYPDVPNFGDMTKHDDWKINDTVDIIVGGTPCQDFSIAGLRAGLDGDRGNLSLEFGRIAAKLRPRWLLWENVPVVLSSNAGQDFATILGLFSGQVVDVPDGGWSNFGIIPGYRNAYGLAYRVLDAQYCRVDGFGRAVPQRRRRLFIVGYIGDWRRAAAVLFEPEGLRRDSPPRRVRRFVAVMRRATLGRAPPHTRRMRIFARVSAPLHAHRSARQARRRWPAIQGARQLNGGKLYALDRHKNPDGRNARQARQTRMTDSAATHLVKQTILALSADPDVRAWRNNTGVAWMGRPQFMRNGSVLIADPRRVAFGVPGSGDIIGFQRITITPEMVGQTIGRYITVECKSGKGRQSELQTKFERVATAFGAAYVVARDPADAVKGIKI